MNFRQLKSGRGAGWIVDGIAIFKSRPGPFLNVCLLIGLFSSIPIVSLFAGLFSVFFYGGIVSTLHTQAQGELPRLAQAFDGFRHSGAAGRLLMILLLNIAVAVIAVIAIAITIGPMLLDLVRQGKSPEPAIFVALLPRLGIVCLFLVPLGIFVGWITMLAVPRAMLDAVPGGQAIREAVSVIFANIGALLVNLLCLFSIGIILLLALIVPLLLINALSLHQPFLGTLLEIPLMTVLTGAIFAVYGSSMYQAWREIHSNVDSIPAVPGSIEV